jgi:hypothetical protein
MYPVLLLQVDHKLSHPSTHLLKPLSLMVCSFLATVLWYTYYIEKEKPLKKVCCYNGDLKF